MNNNLVMNSHIKSPIERRLYYVSDLHLELRKKVPKELIFVPQDENIRNFLALCGDIGCPFHDNYNKFLAIHSLLYERIFVITGNHEYYTNNKQKTMEQIEEQLRGVVSKFSNVTFLHINQPFVLEDILFIGCPLWTNVDIDADNYMNDYNKIYVKQNSTNTSCMYSYSINSIGYTKKKWNRPDRRLLQVIILIVLHSWVCPEIQHIIGYLKRCSRFEAY